MSIGLIEGWQHFEDSERTEHPLLEAEKWCELLTRSGFEGVTALPEPGSPAAAVGQHVLLARRGVHDAANADSAVAAERQRPVHAVVRERAGAAAATDVDWSGLNADEREDKVGQCVRQTICRVFGLQVAPEALGDRDRLSDLGMDSLIALELRGELAKILGLEGRIPSTIGFDTGTVGELTRSLAALLQPAAGTQGEARAASPSPVTVTAEALQEMSEARVEQLLMERMKKR
jgi:acyl carrier protein